MRIAIGGIAHETNTFSTLPTQTNDFRISEGDALVAGPFWRDLEAQGHTFVPLFAARATPSGPVARDAFTSLLDELIEGLIAAAASGPVDGVLLVLHGAMEVEGIGDGEAAILRAVRSALGEGVFIAVTLDLHANLAGEVVERSDLVTAYRTAPHRDVEETTHRATSLMVRCLESGIRPASAMVKLPLLVAGEAAVTEVEPARSLFARLVGIDRRPGILTSSILIGCAWTDSPYDSVGVVVCGTDRAASAAAADEIALEVWRVRERFAIDSETAELDEAIDLALASDLRPVFISDSGDNTTAGAAGDLPLVLSRLVERGVAGALVAGITDPAAVEHCLASTGDEEIDLLIGGKLDRTNGTPYACRGRVLASRRLPAPTGPRVLLRIGATDVVIQSDRHPFTQLDHFSDLGVSPESYHLIVVKEGYLFPELRDYAPRHIMAMTPGFGNQRLDRLPYEKLNRPIYPLDADTRWPA